MYTILGPASELSTMLYYSIMYTDSIRTDLQKEPSLIVVEFF